MPKSTCRNCTPEPDAKPDDRCVFAIYTRKVGGKKMTFCCENSARNYKKPAKGKVKPKSAKRTGKRKK